MSKNTQVMSLSVKPQQHERLKQLSAERTAIEGRKVPFSEIVRLLIDDFLFLDPQVHDNLRKAADKRNILVSDLVEYLTNKFLTEDDSSKPIVLKVPSDVAGDRDLLQTWLLRKVSALLNHLHPTNTN